MAKRFIPNQHGAWSMLVVPYVFGMAAAGPDWIHALLFVGWLAAYLFSHAFLQWMRTRRTAVYGTPMLTYGIILACSGGAAALLAPRLLAYLPLFVPMLLVNIHFARHNRERAFLNDLAAVIQFSLVVFVAYAAGGGDDLRLAAELFLFSVLYYTGTIFFVKTMIREKHNVRYYAMSVAYHLAVLAAAAPLFPAGMLLPLAVLLIRAIWTPRTNMPIKKVGMLEFAYSVLILVVFLRAYNIWV